MVNQAILWNVFIWLLVLQVGTVFVHGEGTSNNRFPFVELGSHGQISKNGPTEQYEGYSKVYLSSPIRFGFRSFYSVFINIGGVLSFKSAQQSRASSALPYSTSSYVIAPFWDNIRLGDYGQIRYEVHDLSTSSDLSSRQLLSQVTNYIYQVTRHYYTITSLLVVEWKDVTSSYSNAMNTFQTLIASTDSVESFAIFTYNCVTMTWFTSSTTIGYKTSRWGQYRSNPFSRSTGSVNPLACINQPGSPWSNVVYRIDSGAESCTSSQYGCDSGGCVSYAASRCNSYYDCSDLSDETGCAIDPCLSNPCDINAVCTHSASSTDFTCRCQTGFFGDGYTCHLSCQPGMFQCNNYQCVASHRMCDGHRDCSDLSDEDVCPQTTTTTTTAYYPGRCSSSQFQCQSYHECVNKMNWCDGNRDCSDGSDELHCSNARLAPGTIAGFTLASLVGITLICVIATIIIIVQVKKRRARRAQFQRLISTHMDPSSTSGIPPVPEYSQVQSNTQTAQVFSPKPDEWYHTVEGDWVQGPPPAYATDAGQGEGVTSLGWEGANSQSELMGQPSLAGDNMAGAVSTSHVAFSNQSVSPVRLTIPFTSTVTPDEEPCLLPPAPATLGLSVASGSEDQDPDLPSQEPQRQIIAPQSGSITLEETSSQGSMDEPGLNEVTPLIES